MREMEATLVAGGGGEGVWETEDDPDLHDEPVLMVDMQVGGL